MQNKHGVLKHTNLNQKTMDKIHIFPSVPLLFYFFIVFRAEVVRMHPCELGCYGFSLKDLMFPLSLILDK